MVKALTNPLVSLW